MFVALLTAVLYSALLTRYSQIEVQARFEEPNGYHALVDAGAAFSKSQIFDGAADFLPGKTVRKEIQNYASTFAQVEEALKQNCLIAAKDGKVDPSDPFSGATDGMASMRSIARALRVKSRQAMSDDDPDAALGDAIQCLKLKLPLSRAQLLVGELVAVAVEGIGADMAYATIEDASDESLQDTLKVLSELEALPQDVELIRDREQQRLWQHGNWKYRLAILSWVDDDVNFQVDQAIKRNTACRRQLVLAICLELYRRENDALPNALEELVPGYIAEIPEDPFAIDPAQPLKYCVGEDGRYTLYSVGGDGQDNAGRLDADQYWNTEGSDINFAECCRINRIEFLRNAQLGRLDSVQAEE